MDGRGRTVVTSRVRWRECHTQSLAGAAIENCPGERTINEGAWHASSRVKLRPTQGCPVSNVRRVGPCNRWRPLVHGYNKRRTFPGVGSGIDAGYCRSEEHTSELQSLRHL